MCDKLASKMASIQVAGQTGDFVTLYIAAGLEIEKNQYNLIHLMEAYDCHELQATRKEIDCNRDQVVLVPQLVDHIGLSSALDVEHQSLYLPSALPSQQHMDWGLVTMVEIESKLQEAVLNDDGNKVKKKHATGQAANMHTMKLIETSERMQVECIAQYNQHREALISLREYKDVESNENDEKKKQRKGKGRDETKLKGTGEEEKNTPSPPLFSSNVLDNAPSKDQSAFVNLKAFTPGEDMKAWEEEANMVQYFHAEAEFLQWHDHREQKIVELIQHICSCERREQEWTTIADNLGREGAKAYAKKKSAMWHQMASNAHHLLDGISDRYFVNGTSELANIFLKEWQMEASKYFGLPVTIKFGQVSYLTASQ
ncbi:hypothetical protein FISHEDRAFT_59776 [Fistulina hepatica ATCC 64428]|uniref:Uncharacterized protein n=1 Tax=Fistulina hepatica ATCC 64428 TaxID=1128425 RepID=A0A0D7A937_9AGAR|nr:hypothetical protein FISHEDRAFT_59776 [Fistulina hepatica ATCC 64428]